LTGNASGSAATFTSTTQNSQFNSIGVGVAASTTAGQINATRLVSSNASAQSLTDGAVVLNGAAGSILIDDGGHKRISWNDGGGNLNIRSGNYYNGTALVYAKGVADTNGGAAAITLSTDSAIDGSILLSVAAIGVPGATVTYSKNLTLGTTGLTFDGNFTPVTTNSYTLGSSGFLWSNVYSITFTGALTGNASTAKALAHSRTSWGQGFTGADNVTERSTSV